jgi:hypothetical protein
MDAERTGNAPNRETDFGKRRTRLGAGRLSEA